MKHTVRVAVVGLVVASSMTLAGTAAAHERRMVGPFEFVVGWLTEPAYQDQPNAATVHVIDTRVNPARAVDGLESTLSIQIFSGGLATAFAGKIHTLSGQPGLYALDVIPTAVGGYKIRVTGKIDALAVNEMFESGPATFSDIVALSALQYPVPVPVGTDLTRQLDDLTSSVEQTRLLAIVAVVLGLVAIGVGFARRRHT